MNLNFVIKAAQVEENLVSRGCRYKTGILFTCKTYFSIWISQDVEKNKDWLESSESSSSSTDLV